MIDQGRNNVMGVVIDAVDYERAVEKIIESAQQGKRCATTALAVHGLITGVTDEAHRFRLNQFDLVVPDGQPVRWALNVLHRAQLTDRVYGPKLSLRVCEAAARQGVSVYFFGSSKTVIQKLCEGMSRRCPGLQIAGARPSEFRTLTEAERNELVAEIQASGAQILFVGLGCPRQEVFAYEMSQYLNMPILAVGAAFDYYAGTLTEPPEFMQKWGLQWLYRLVQEPRRLWKRYLVTNTQFVALFGMQAIGLWRPDPANCKAPLTEVRYG